MTANSRFAKVRSWYLLMLAKGLLSWREAADVYGSSIFYDNDIPAKPVFQTSGHSLIRGGFIIAEHIFEVLTFDSGPWRALAKGIFHLVS